MLDESFVISLTLCHRKPPFCFDVSTMQTLKSHMIPSCFFWLNMHFTLIHIQIPKGQDNE